ncbi:FdhF/YdeP family oxidoreductase [Arthrobacter russicus]|uniref:Molybdopterin-dependent oxidoreductase alpha subunit n=1 Tax=Arthrobacter russicus TaxID=172040 RepID=A0ABU1JFU4_9MICC|nr:FdhF/YdeP family oxidoreductase [Arthrobacter russicus]MDR6271015.1 molybdopterin-dependent oxidoreductase alpha subunit [Arthrobacter russicus]
MSAQRSNRDEAPGALPAGLGPVAGLLPAMPRQGGYGPVSTRDWSQLDYHHPAAGWGAAMSVGKVLLTQGEVVSGSLAMIKMNHPVKGFDCPGCAWPDDNKGLMLDICENGIKHVTWEMTRKRVDPQFFAKHSVTELATWTDFELENQGRLTYPMVYNADTDHYEPISWDAAFELVAEELRALASPNQAAFYTSGRLSNEATFVYQLMVREFGTNNLPDCSNMCHEASGRALQASLGTGKGTCDLDDWEECDALFIMGVNAASNAPRMLTALSEATKRGAAVVHINPLVEAGATRTIVPHDIVDMALFKTSSTSTLNLQVRPGGDLALLRGMAKALYEAAESDPGAIDQDFLDAYTSGSAEYRELVAATSWAELSRQAGLGEAEIRQAAEVYRQSDKSIFSWCLGITQHEHGVDTVREIVNLLALRGNLGRLGAGPSPVRGHSNVQGNRTCGIDHRPAGEFLDRLDAVCGITSPREPGLDTVGIIKAMHDDELKVFVGLGGNFVLAAPDTIYTARGMQKCELTVQVSTKLNRSHLVHGKKALILPCLGRTEEDLQASGPQGVSCEDAMSMVQLSVGRRKPASPHLLSETAIINGMARALLPQSATPWESYTEDYDAIREVMARVLPGFEDYNSRVREPLGFRIAQPPREREFQTPSGLVEFSQAPLPDVIPADAEVLVLQTMRSHDQWNTTIYSDNDRYRGVKNLRELIFLNKADMSERGIGQGDFVDITATAKDGSLRSLRKYRALEYNLPRGSAAGYMPEMNVLIGWSDYSTQSDQPLMKNLKVRVVPAQ